MPNNNLLFVEQSVFSATVSQMELIVKQFSKVYNYSLHQGNRIKNQNYYVSDLNQLVSIHYHNIFRTPKTYNSITNKVLKTDKGKVISGLIKEFNVLKQYSIPSFIQMKIKKKIKDILKKFKYKV